MNKAISKSGKMLLSPTDHALIMIDFQSQMAFAAKSIDAVTLRNNAALAANAARWAYSAYCWASKSSRWPSD